MFERPLFRSIVGSSSDLWPDDDDDDDGGGCCMFLPHIEQGRGMAPIACGLWLWPNSLLAADVTEDATFAARFFKRRPSFLCSLHLRFHASISFFHFAASCTRYARCLHQTLKLLTVPGNPITGIGLYYDSTRHIAGCAWDAGFAAIKVSDVQENLFRTALHFEATPVPKCLVLTAAKQLAAKADVKHSSMASPWITPDWVWSGKHGATIRPPVDTS